LHETNLKTRAFNVCAALQNNIWLASFAPNFHKSTNFTSQVLSFILLNSAMYALHVHTTESN